MKNYTKPRMTERMPAVPISPEFKERIQDEARRRGMSVSELIRQATSFFLDNDYSKTILDYRKSKINEPPTPAA